MFQKAAVIVLEELTWGAGEDDGVVWAERVPASRATERSRARFLGGMMAGYVKDAAMARQLRVVDRALRAGWDSRS